METKVERMNLLNLKIPREKLERIVDNLVGIHMLCDVLENFSNEIEYILQENAPDWHVESFNNILKLGEQASEQIEWIAENTDLMEYKSWGNECDNFTDMVRNKAHKLLKDAAERRVRNKEKEEETNNDN